MEEDFPLEAAGPVTFIFLSCAGRGGRRASAFFVGESLPEGEADERGAVVVEVDGSTVGTCDSDASARFVRIPDAEGGGAAKRSGASARAGMAAVVAADALGEGPSEEVGTTREAFSSTFLTVVEVPGNVLEVFFAGAFREGCVSFFGPSRDASPWILLVCFFFMLFFSCCTPFFTSLAENDLLSTV